MQGINIEIVRSRLLLRDLDNKGSLHISFTPFKKVFLNPAFEAFNDLEHAINNGKLNLQLFGHNTIREQAGFDLRGNVVLSSCHLYDCKIDNSALHMVSIKQKSVISDSKLAYIGINRYGFVSFKECDLKNTPPVTLPNHSYFRNVLV